MPDQAKTNPEPAKPEPTPAVPPPPSNPSGSVPPPPAASFGVAYGPNGVNGPMPPELRGWNWGAFFMTWIWGVSNNVWISLLTFIPVLSFIMPFVLGAKGNEWAWEHRHFDSVEHFKSVQKTWAWWGLGLFILSIIAGIGIIMSFLLASSQGC